MISCSCDIETFSPFVEREHRARKQHTCDDCGGTIAAGEGYLYHGGLYDCEWSMYKRCADCRFMVAEVGRSLMADCGGWDCVYVGDLAQSWEDLVYDLCPGEITDREADEIVRICAMQHAVSEARGGRKWPVPDCAIYQTCPECGEDVPRRDHGPLCDECAADGGEG